MKQQQNTLNLYIHQNQKENPNCRRIYGGGEVFHKFNQDQETEPRPKLTEFTPLELYLRQTGEAKLPVFSDDARRFFQVQVPPSRFLDTCRVYWVEPRCALVIQVEPVL